MRSRVGTLIVGGGPAGLAPLVAASRDGRLDALLETGVAVVERGTMIGAGRLGAYAISSDSTAETFLTAITGHRDPRLGQLLSHPLSRSFAALGRASVPLRDAARLMHEVGQVLAEAVTASGGAVLTGHEALDAQLTRRGSWQVRLRDRHDGAERRIEAEHLLLATGGSQELEHLVQVEVGGRPLLPQVAGRLMLSDHVLRPEGLGALRARLALSARPKVVILGGSTSALATAGLLLRDCADLLEAPGSVTILHRRPLRVFYPSATAARAEGYEDFGADDICPLSGFVFRLAGFRTESRELVMGVLGIGGRPPEPRVTLRRIGAQHGAELRDCLERADAVVAATGYRPRALPVADAQGEPIPLRGMSGHGPLVDPACRICDADGHPVPNLFAIGLAAGFVPQGALGGEPSFRGQANGLWLWQTAVGTMLVDSFLAGTPESLDLPLSLRSPPPVARIEPDAVLSPG